MQEFKFFLARWTAARIFSNIVYFCFMPLEIIKSEIICYCFNYTANDIKADSKKHGRSLILEKIVHEKKNNSCDCANKNPKGK